MTTIEVLGPSRREIAGWLTAQSTHQEVHR